MRGYLTYKRWENPTMSEPKSSVISTNNGDVTSAPLSDADLYFYKRRALKTGWWAVIGSIEYAVAVLEVPLIVVLGHDSCGAVKATITALDDGAVPGGYVRDIVERVTPSILVGRREGLSEVDELEAKHVNETVRLLAERSNIIAERLASGKVAIVGATYHLAEGRVTKRDHVGDIGE